MLSAQRRDFDEKKKDEGPYPRDFGRWLPLDYFRRPRALRSRRFYVTLMTTLIVATLSFRSTSAPTQVLAHQAGPVSRAHAGFNQDCNKCHDRPFQAALRLAGSAQASISDSSCKQCHRDQAIHHAKQAHEPECATCHREHRGHQSLATHVTDQNCTSCHRQLQGHLQPDAKTAFHSAITSFSDNHPEFRAAEKGQQDPGKLKFNHMAHLDLNLDALRKARAPGQLLDLQGLGAKMACADCHQPDGEYRYFRPINYDNHCARCHALNIGLVGAFPKELKPAVDAFSKTALPHREPALVRAALRDRLVEFAQKHNIVPGPPEPQPRPLPWKPATDAHWTWAIAQGKSALAVDSMHKLLPKLEEQTACLHCHQEEGRTDIGLPLLAKSNIPLPWFKHSVFNHGSHKTMSCEQCHDANAAQVKVSESQTAADVLLPDVKSCQECHGPASRARSACVECHRYHTR